MSDADEMSALLAYYSELRAELRLRMRRQGTLLARGIGATGVVAGYAIVQEVYGLLLYVPFVLGLLFVLFTSQGTHIWWTARYLATIESHIEAVAGSGDDPIPGWERDYAALAGDRPDALRIGSLDRGNWMDLPMGVLALLAAVTYCFAVALALTVPNQPIRYWGVLFDRGVLLAVYAGFSLLVCASAYGFYRTYVTLRVSETRVPRLRDAPSETPEES